MKNFVPFTINRENDNVLTASVKLMPRSLVLLSSTANKHGVYKAYNICTKMRYYSLPDMVRALTKAILAMERVVYLANQTPDAQKSERYAYNDMRSALRLDTFAAVDKDGEIIPDSVWNAGEANVSTLSKAYKVARTKPLYKLVVEQGKDWSDREVSKTLSAWVNATIEQFDLDDRKDTALGKAANHTESMDKEREKAEKAAEKAEKAEKETEAKAA